MTDYREPSEIPPPGSDPAPAGLFVPSVATRVEVMPSRGDADGAATPIS